MASPCRGVPRPGGRPKPSGEMLMFHGAISSAVATCPRLGPSAAMANVERQPKIMVSRILRENMFHLALVGDAPGGDRVGVIDGPVTSALNHLFAGGLNITRLVGYPAFQNCRTTIPTPWQAKTSQSLR